MTTCTDLARDLTRHYVSDILHDCQTRHARGVLVGLCPFGRGLGLADWRHGDRGMIMDLETGREVVARILSRLEAVNVDCAIRHFPGIEHPRHRLVLGWTVQIAACSG